MNGEHKYKTLYLLHGLLGNYTDWVSQTRIHKWAEEKNLAVVMPSGDNAFYFKSRTPWNDYETFIGKELPYCRPFHGRLWRTEKWNRVFGYV